MLENRTSIVISKGILLFNPDRRGRGGLKILIFAGRPKWMAPKVNGISKADFERLLTLSTKGSVFYFNGMYYRCVVLCCVAATDWPWYEQNVGKV